MNINWRKYHIWLFIANWIAAACVLFIVFERRPGQEGVPMLVDFMAIPEQSPLLVFVLILGMIFILVRGYSAFMIYMTNYNTTEDTSGDWLNEEEQLQKNKEQQTKHQRLLFSLLLTLVTFVGHYIVGLFVADFYIATAYILSSWLIGLSCIISLREGRIQPGLSTYEFAAKNRLMLYSYIMLASVVLIAGALLSVVLRQTHTLCIGIAQCLSEALAQTYNEPKDWIVNLWSYDWVIYALTLVFFLSAIRLYQTLLLCRSDTLGFYRRIILLTIVSLLIIFIIDQIVQMQHFRLAMDYIFFALASYVGIFLLKDLPPLRRKDSVLHRSEIFKAMIRDSKVKS